MIVMYDSNNHVAAVFEDGTNVANLNGVTELPSAEQQTGKQAVLCIDPTNNSLSYQYTDRPLTQSEKIAQDEEQQANIVLALVQGGLM